MVTSKKQRACSAHAQCACSAPRVGGGEVRVEAAGTGEVKTALSKAGTAVWGGAGGMVEAKSASMGDYFERGGMNR